MAAAERAARLKAKAEGEELAIARAVREFKELREIQRRCRKAFLDRFGSQPSHEQMVDPRRPWAEEYVAAHKRRKAIIASFPALAKEG